MAVDRLWLLHRGGLLRMCNMLARGIRAMLGYWSDQRVRFIIIGALNTVFGYAAFVLLYTLLSDLLNYLTIALLAHACAATASFATQKVLVFRSIQHWLPEFLRYNVSLLVGLTAGLIGLWTLVSIVALHPIVAQAIIMLLVIALNYLMHSRFSFANSNRAR
ncbi:GtrA family protein [uncultured Thiodictyon sp.]|uniref:GtrA family protein n=1 Tax=uncultured Thiodictyon sp. TaxID=1846217 RepID=UPI0025FA85C6|nr:GtrA family protein [uncultured Thiodictyon sp.]